MHKQIKILFFTHYSGLYGANRSLIDIIEGLRTFGVLGTVVIPHKGELENLLKEKNIPFVIHHFMPWIFFEESKSESIRAKVRFFLKKVKKQKKTLNYNKQRLVDLSKHVFKEDDFDLVYSNTSVFDFGYNYSKLTSVKHVWHLRETPEQYKFNWIFNISKVRKSFKNSDLIFSVSNYVKDNFSSSLYLKDIIVEYNSVMSRDRLYQLDATSSVINKCEEGFFTFGIVGLIHPNKGQLEAIKAFKIVMEEYPLSKLLIIGGGDDTELLSLIKLLNLENNVCIIGKVYNPFNYYLKMNAYLMCSKKEGLGRVTLEAMSVGLPIIAYKDGGTTEIIKENYNGLFYENGHPELAKKMIFLIKNKKLRKTLGTNGRRYFEDNFINEIYVGKIYSYLSNMIN